MGNHLGGVDLLACDYLPLLPLLAVCVGGPGGGVGLAACGPVPLIFDAAIVSREQLLGERIWAGIKSVRKEIVQPARSGAVTLLRKVFRRSLPRRR